jgi:hypothetical protein
MKSSSTTGVGVQLERKCVVMAKQLFEYAIILQEKTDKDGDVKEEAGVIDSWSSCLRRTRRRRRCWWAARSRRTGWEHLERMTLAVRPF